MTNKKWYSDWQVTYRRFVSKTQPGHYTVDIPNSFGTSHKYSWTTRNKSEDNKIYNLVEILDCAFTELTNNEKNSN